MSSSRQRGTRAIASPVAGLIASIVSPLRASRNSPPTRIGKVSSVVSTAMSSLPPPRFEVGRRLVERDDVAVLLLQVEQRLRMRRLRAVADRLADDDRDEAVLHGVDRR